MHTITRLTLLEMFDDCIRQRQMLVENDCGKEFKEFVLQHKFCHRQWQDTVGECQRLKIEIEKMLVDISESEKKLARARKLLHEEQAKAEKAIAERDEMQDHLLQIQDVMSCFRTVGGQLANETRDKLDKLDRFLSTTQAKAGRPSGEGLYPALHTIDETGDLLSDLSCSRSEDNLGNSFLGLRMKKPRRSSPLLENDEVPSKKRRSSRLSAKSSHDLLVATTTVSMPPGGPVTASARIEAVPSKHDELIFTVPSAPPPPTSSSDSDNAMQTPRKNNLARPHEFSTRTVLRTAEGCNACAKPTSFGTKVMRCSQCKAQVHLDCSTKLPVPCIPYVATPRGELNLENQCPNRPPYIPPLLRHCVNEVEKRGMLELGLYRVPGAEKDVRALKSRFQRAKGTLPLDSYDIHVICGVLKDFLRTLPEPLVTHTFWERFADAVREQDHDRNGTMRSLIAQLPAPNRDTLAFIMLHLLKVSQSPPCKMTPSNLATVFGPTLVGYSSNNPTNHDMCQQTAAQAMIVESLLNLGESYWNNVLEEEAPAPQFTPKYSFRKRADQRSYRLFHTPPTK